MDMFNWIQFHYFGAISVFFGIVATILAYKNKTKMSFLCALMQIFFIACFIVGFWLMIDRPPFKTTGETRLWFSLFMPIAGLIAYKAWNYRWMLLYGTLISTVFICLNIFKPEIHSKELMPALQSIWFVPHVAMYMLSYAFLGAAFIIACVYIFKQNMALLRSADTFVMIGLAFLTIGMMLGSIWAKVAWGDFWTWDVKETWALITWLSYIFYIHLRKYDKKHVKIAIFVLILSFLFLQVCWLGVDYLPTAAGSMHTY